MATASRLARAETLDPAAAPFAHYLLGLVLQSRGLPAQAEPEFRRAAAKAPDEPAYAGALADLLEKQGRHAEAEALYRRVLGIADSVPAAAGLTRLLLLSGRADEAAALIGPRADRQGVPADLLLLAAAAFRAARDPESALDCLDRARGDCRTEAVAAQQRASLLVELGRAADAEKEAAELAGRYGHSPALDLVVARARRMAGHYQGAEPAYRRAAADPRTAPLAARELVELVWMRSGDASLALDTAQAAGAFLPPPLRALLRAEALELTGRPKEGLPLIEQAIAQAPSLLPLRLAAIRLASAGGDPEAALRHARAACDVRPGHRDCETALVEALLGCGKTREAAEIAERLHGAAPSDQRALALLTTAWRLAGDPRYRTHCDYARLIGEYGVPGFTAGSEGLASLAESLRRLHDLRAPLMDQSVRGGTQTLGELARLDDTAVKAFFEAVREPVQRHAEILGGGAWRIAGSWSVRLTAGGYHVDHVHPGGWMSTAFYVDLPPAVTGADQAGWLAFGRPGIATRPELEAEHLVRPEPGKLVIFPSFFWHGTTGFAGPGERLTIAFDVARRRSRR